MVLGPMVGRYQHSMVLGAQVLHVVNPRTRIRNSHALPFHDVDATHPPLGVGFLCQWKRIWPPLHLAPVNLLLIGAISTWRMGLTLL